MGIYYIATQDGQYFELDCTEEVSITDTGRTTEYQLENGAKQTDHYVNENKTISLNGKATDIKLNNVVGVTKNTDEFLTGLDRLKQSKKTFRFYYRNTTSGGVRYLDNCLFESLRTIQDSQDGVFNDYYSYKVAMSFKQIRYANRAEITKEKVPALASSSSDKTKTGAKGKEPSSAQSSSGSSSSQAKKEARGADIFKEGMDQASKGKITISKVFGAE